MARGKLILHTYNNQVPYKTKENEEKHPIKIKRGVRQDSILSPLFFNTFAGEMFKQIITNYGVHINDNLKISKVSYADDTVLIAESEGEPNNQLNEIATKGQDWLIEINMKRTKKS